MILAVCYRWNATEPSDEPAEQEDAEDRTTANCRNGGDQNAQIKNRQPLISAI